MNAYYLMLSLILNTMVELKVILMANNGTQAGLKWMDPYHPPTSSTLYICILYMTFLFKCSSSPSSFPHTTISFKIFFPLHPYHYIHTIIVITNNIIITIKWGQRGED